MGFEQAVICDITQFEKNPQKYISIDRRYFYCIFMTHMTSIYEKKSSAEVRLTHAEFHHFMEKNRHS